MESNITIGPLYEPMVHIITYEVTYYSY